MAGDYYCRHRDCGDRLQENGRHPILRAGDTKIVQLCYAWRMSNGPASSMRRDIVSAYAVTAARVASRVIVSAVVFRRLGVEALGVLTLVRATVGILGYTALGRSEERRVGKECRSRW